jgi:transposase
VVAAVRHMVGGTVRREVRTFKTTTKDLMALSEWLSAEGCTHIAMEATGIYWKPVWHVLGDGAFERFWRTRPMSRTCRAAKPT